MIRRLSRARGLAIAAAALAVAAVLVALLVHAPFVRARVLRYALARVQADYGIQITASRLDYNIPALRIGLADLRIAAVRTPDQPFFTADYLTVVVPWTTVRGGGVAFDEISASNAGVRVVRSADGTMNLPDSQGSDEEPAPLRIDHLAIPQLSVEFVDVPGAVAIRIPAAAIDLAAERGRIALSEPAVVTAGGRTTRITSLAGDATFDGRAITLANAQLVADEATLRVDGPITLIARDPSVDLRVTGVGDLARLARWGMEGDVPAGAVSVTGQVRGPMNDLRAEFEATSPRVQWQQLNAANVSVRAAVNSRALDLQQLQLDLEGGRVSGSGAIPFDAAVPMRMLLSWTDVPAIPIARALAPGTTPLPAAVISGTVDVQGPRANPSLWLIDGRIRAEPLTNARGQVAIGGEARIFMREGSWRLDGDHVVAGVVPLQVLVSGPSEGTAISGMVTLAPTDIPALVNALRVTGLADVPPDAVTAGSAEGEIRLTGTRTAPRFGLTLRAPQLVVQGQALEEVRFGGGLSGNTLTIGALTARQPAEGGSLRAAGTFDISTRAYDLTADVTGWSVTPTGDLPARGIVDGTFRGLGNIDMPTGEARLFVRDAAWDTWWIGNADADVTLGRGNAVIDARAPSIDLAALLKGVETPVPISGEASATAHVEAPINNPSAATVRLEIPTLEARLGDLPLRLLEPARARYAAERLTLERAEAAAGDVRITASGEIDATEAAAVSTNAPGLLVVVSGDVDQVARAVAATGITSLPITGGTGPVGLFARVTGSLETPVVSADVDAGPGTIVLQDLPAITDVTLRARIDEGQVDLRQLTAEFQGARLSATGDAPLVLLTGGANDPATPDTITLFARAQNLNARVLEPFLDAATIEQISGSIDATADLSSTSLNLDDVSGTVTLDRLDVRIADLPVTQRVPTRIVAGGGFARVEAWDWTGQGATLQVRGQVNLARREAGLLADGTVDLRLLSPFVRDAGMSTAGTLRPRLSITGPLDAPRIDGDVALESGEIRLANPRVIVSDLSARALVSRTRATLTGLTGSANGGPLTGEGLIELLEDGRVASSLTTRIRNMALEFPEGLRSEVDSDLTLTLAAGGPEGSRPEGSLAGTVTLVRGAYREPMAVVTGLLTQLRARRLAAAAAPSPLLDALALNVRLITDEDVIVDNNYGRFQLGGDLRLIGTASAPALSGRAELREGGRLFVGRNIYDIQPGSVINFANPTVIEPEMNIQAMTNAGGVDITVTITGTAEAPSVDLQGTDIEGAELSDPELASLLLTGRSFDDLAPGDAAFIGTQLLGNFSAEVLGFASRAIGLDTVRLGGVDTGGLGGNGLGGNAVRRDPTAVATETDPTTRLTFGKSIGSDLDVTFSQSLRNGAAQTWIVDYLPVRRLELRFVSNDDNMRTAGFRHDVTFGGPPRIQSEGVSQRVRAEGARQQRVAAVQIGGDLVVPEEQVRRQLRLEPGDRFDFADWQDDRDRLEQFYRRQGYLTVRVSATRSDGDMVALTYTIAPGPRATIVATGIELDDTLRSRLEDAWATSIFDEFLVDEAELVVRESLAASGFNQATVSAMVTGSETEKTLTVAVERGPEGPPRVETSAAPQSPAEPRSPQQRIASVTFTGNLDLPEDRVRDAAGLTAGTAYDAIAADTARARLITFYRFEGFTAPQVTVRVDPLPADPAQVQLAFTIEAGPRQVLREVMVAGNRSIDTDVVVRAVNIAPGTPLTATESLRARTRVFETGLFRRVDVVAEALDSTQGPGIGDVGSVPMRLRVTVEEWPALRLRYGLQIAEERPEGEIEGRDLVPGLSADLTRRTLFGRAIATGAAVQYQRRERMGRLFLNAPTLLGWPIESSLVLERSREEFTAVTLVTDASALAWEQRARFFDNLTLSYVYKFERNHTFDTEPNPNDPLGPFDITINIGRITGSAAWDTRDDPSNSRRGLLSSISVEVAPEFAGSDIRFRRYVGQTYYFRTWRQVVFASAARAGVVEPMGEQDLILSERFFAGGARTVRGVGEDALGERNFFDEPVGGEALLVLNQEARVPVYKWLGAVAFIDAGNVFTRPRDLSLRDLTGSIGVGLRLDSPFALLRVDWGKAAWNAGPATGAGRWTFGIGQAF